MKLIHGTSTKVLDKIRSAGFPPFSYWTNNEYVAEYYAEEATEEYGGDFSFFTIELSNLDISSIQPDYPSLEEPLTHTLGVSEDDIWEAWENSNKTWEDSLRIVNSIRYTKPIPPNLLESRTTINNDIEDIRRRAGISIAEIIKSS